MKKAIGVLLVIVIIITSIITIKAVRTPKVEYEGEANNDVEDYSNDINMLRLANSYSKEAFEYVLGALKDEDITELKKFLTSEDAEKLLAFLDWSKVELGTVGEIADVWGDPWETYASAEIGTSLNYTMSIAYTFDKEKIIDITQIELWSEKIIELEYEDEIPEGWALTVGEYKNGLPPDAIYY